MITCPPPPPPPPPNRKTALDRRSKSRSDRRYLFVVLGALIATVACGDPNRAPILIGSLSAQTVVADTELDVNSYFVDPDGDQLGYTAASSDTTVASVSISGSLLTVSPSRAGQNIITVGASDPSGLSVQLTFPVTVTNQAPVVVERIPRQSVFVGDSLSVDVTIAFTDPEGGNLTYAAEISNTGIAAITSVSESTVLVSGVKQGQTVLTITAYDSVGLSSELPVSVKVPNRAPIALCNIPLQRVHWRSVLQRDFAPCFTDLDGDELKFGATTSNSGDMQVFVSGSVVTFAPRSTGVTQNTVRATDPGGPFAEITFIVQSYLF